MLAKNESEFIKQKSIQPEKLQKIIEDETDDDDKASSADDNEKTGCGSYWFHFVNDERGVKGLYSNHTALLMCGTMIVVVIFLFIQESTSFSLFLRWYSYIAYLFLFLFIFFFWLLIRAIWMSVPIKRLTQSRAFVAINVVLDPELTHLCATVSNLLFCAYIPSLNLQNNEAMVNILGIGSIPKKDFQILLKTNLILIIWAAKDLLRGILVFRFLTGLLMTFNGQLVKFLTLYRLTRKLNSNWQKLYSVFAAYIAWRNRQKQSKVCNKSFSISAPLRRQVEKRDILKPKSRVGRNLSLKGHFRSRLPSSINVETINEFYVDYIPSILQKDNIAETSKNAVSNLLALEYCRQNPCTFNQNDTSVKFLNKVDAKTFARQQFDEFLYFCNAVASNVKDESERCSIATNALLNIQRLIQQVSRNGDASMDMKDLYLLDSYVDPTLMENKIANISHQEVTSIKIGSQEDLTEDFCLPQPFPQQESYVPSTVNGPFVGNNSIGDGEDNERNMQLTHLTAPWPLATEARKVKTYLKEDGEDCTFKRATEDNLNGSLESLHCGTKNAMNSLYLSRSFLEVLLDKDINAFMSLVDIGDRGYVTRSSFVNIFVEMYKVRKQIVTLLASQEVMRNIVSRIISGTLIFFSLLLFFLVTGASPETVILSGVAVFASCSAILNLFYTGLVQSIIYICLLNPYNVGDRVVMDGTLRTVKKIHTYYTEFFTVHGKIETINHSTLFETPITNESRAKNAGIYIELRVDINTPDSKIFALNYKVEEFVQNRHEFIKDTFFFYVDQIVIGYYKQIVYFVTAVDSWGLYITAYYKRALVIRFIAKECIKLGIKYYLPVMPVTTKC